MAVHVSGLKEFINRLDKAGVELSDLKDAMRSVGEVVARAARPLTRPKSGFLSGSIRPSRTKNKAIVRAGGAKAPYAGPQHFGWRARNIKPNPFLYSALDSRRDEVLTTFHESIDKAIGN